MNQRGSILIMALVALVAIGGAFLGGYGYGQRVEAAQQAQKREKAITAAVTQANEQTAADMATAYEVGLAKGRARTAAATNRQEFSIALSAAPRRPDACDMPPAAYDRLLDAVSLANADETAAKLVPASVPKPAAALKPPSR